MPHFEIYVDDVPRAKAFYEGLFGWTITPAPMGEDIEYQIITGGGFVAPDAAQGGLTGGMMRRMGAASPAGSPVRGGTMTFDVADCDERYAWALANGGSEALPPETMPGVGRFAYVEDGEGNIVGFLSQVEEGAQ
ncbi:VOC family protein [Pacificoceanicola onchidii]|uniref:VOC family protein n=1 Tax=Pacificoceanicola onchidii TaxID=2562685 RepID=UPI0010A5C867|nr:VOC family protein [Pacificoceanicola onchidii]